METERFNMCIPNIFYTPIHTRLNMTGPPDTIRQVKPKIKNHGEKIVRDFNIPLEYMEYLEPGYSWSDHVIGDY